LTTRLTTTIGLVLLASAALTGCATRGSYEAKLRTQPWGDAWLACREKIAADPEYKAAAATIVVVPAVAEKWRHDHEKRCMGEAGWVESWRDEDGHTFGRPGWRVMTPADREKWLKDTAPPSDEDRARADSIRKRD
jgi:hypothetical protein